MFALKRIVTVVVMVYLLIALLFLLFPAVRTTVGGFGTSDPYHERDFYATLCWVGVAVLGLHLVVENLDSILLRRTLGQQDNRINELKAKLYDNQAAPIAPPAGQPSVAYPTAAEAAERDRHAPNAPLS